MWKIATTPHAALPDLARFVRVLNSHADFFQPGVPLSVGRAPGRLDLMGGIADYSGSLVLELPLGVAAFVAVQPATTLEITLRSTSAAEFGDEPQVRLACAELTPNGEPLPYAVAHAQLSADARRAWAAYPLGVLLVLMHEHGLRLTGGLHVFIHSDVPPGKGVSSSAAVEVATAQAVVGLMEAPAAPQPPLAGANPPRGPRELALLCQQAENLVVGAPCGVMDQMTSACGEQDRLLALLCQPAELQGSVQLPPSLEVWGIDSGIRHAVSGADYGSVRVGAFMGLRMIQELNNVAGHTYNGYLANVPPSEWEQRYRAQVPETISGAAFLDRYGSTTDTVTRVDPERVYAVRQSTAHPIYEHHRVRLFRALLETWPAATDGAAERAGLLGELMYQSHASYSACGLGSDGTDRLVELARQAGPEAGIYGAKITGGGSGGTVAVLAWSGAAAQIQQIAEQYQTETGRSAAIIGGSSPGAAAVGALRMTDGTE